MYFQIRELVLWPRHEAPPRRVAFAPGKVNIISGASKTGKSAIIPIIDYCLAARSCAIPTGVIRQACQWFGILIDTGEGQKLLAREEPGAKQQTENMFLTEGQTVEIPQRIPESRTRASEVRAMLNRLSGVSNLGFEPDGSSSFAARASFRDFMAFVFQPQNVVANPDVLFFKADTNEHREKLKTIFPYVLGAVTPATLLAMWELDMLSKTLRRKERELQNLEDVAARWRAEASSWLDRARELGLLAPDTAIPERWTALVAMLRNLVGQSFSDAATSVAGIDATLTQTFALMESERRLAGEVFELRQRLAQLEELKESGHAYGAALHIQRDRLALSSWLRALSEPDASGPLHSPIFAPSTELDQLCEALEQVELETSHRPSASETIDRELLRVRAALAQAIENHHALKRRLTDQSALRPAPADPSSILQGSPPAFSISEIERYLGRLEQALLTYETVGSDDNLASQVASLREQVAGLEARVSPANIRVRLERALNAVQAIAATIIPKLDAEFPERPIKLSTTDLSVKVIGPDREDWLWEIGSGANWLTYHVAVTAALQRYFMQDKEHPVPHLLVYDQPSQVYFPRALVGEQPEPVWRDEDTRAVRKVFAALADEVQLSQKRLQVIILDHAGEDVWRGVPQLHVIPEWRGGEKLVPEAWLQNRSQ